MENTTPNRIETNPIGIPNQYANPANSPPNEYFQPSSINSNHQFMNSPTNFSPRADPPNFHPHEARSSFSNNLKRPSNLTKNLLANNQPFQIPNPSTIPQHYQSRQNSLQSPIKPPQAVNMFNPQTGEYSSFNANNQNQYIPSDHNTPTVVSGSYSSAPSSSLNQNFFNFKPAQPTTDISMDSAIAGSATTNQHPPHEQYLSTSYSNQQLHNSFRSHNTLSSSLPHVPRPRLPSISTDSIVSQAQFFNQDMKNIDLSNPDHYMTYQEYLTNLDPSEDHLDIADYPVNDLLLMLSSLLTKIIEANDKLHPNHFNNSMNHLTNQHGVPQSDELDDKNRYLANVLAFHGKNVPGISLHSYLTRILKYCPVTNEVFLSLLVYFDRIAKKANVNDTKQSINTSPSSQASSSEQLFVMDSFNIHRLIISGITISSKFFSDIFYKNLRYAKVGGLPLEELNYLELQFLLLLDFKLLISLNELQKYGDLLLRFWKRENYKNELLNQQQQQQQTEAPGGQTFNSSVPNQDQSDDSNQPSNYYQGESFH